MCTSSDKCYFYLFYEMTKPRNYITHTPPPTKTNKHRILCVTVQDSPANGQAVSCERDGLLQTIIC